jgi:uncharacterized protein (TIGR02757 family)
MERLYEGFNAPDSAADPVHVVRRYSRPEDREVIGFLAAAFAFGRVASVIQSIERICELLGPSPAEAIRSFDPDDRRLAVRSFVHRWIGGTDLLALLWIVKHMLKSGSIEAFFLRGYRDAHGDVGPALDAFSIRALGLELKPIYRGRPRRPGVSYFFPRPAHGSACKRLNLFLRWMIRRDAIDLGVWTGVPPSKLVIPLDTHVVRVGRCLGLTRYKSPGWRMAEEITSSLRRLDPTDPVKYDFSICHLGMQNACGFSRAQKDSICPLRGVCRPTGRRPTPSR